MNFIEAASRARSPGVAIRCRGWAEGVAIMWSWDHLRWLGVDDHREPAYKFERLVDVPSHPNPNDIQRDDWEAVDLA